MPVTLAQRLANASRDLDSSVNQPFFTSINPEIVGMIELNRAGETWEFGTSQASLTVGQLISWRFPAVPRNEFHEYHLICPQYAEVGDKTATLIVDNPAPTAGAECIPAHRIMDMQRGLNILGRWSQVDTSSGVQVVNRLSLPPGFTMRLDITTGLVGAGPTSVFLSILRRILDAPGDTLPAAAIPAVIT